MYRPCYVVPYTQEELQRLIIYKEGEVFTSQGLKINGGNIRTFHLEGTRYYLCDLVYVYLYGPIPEGKKVSFYDKDRFNLKACNLYLL